MRRLLPTPRVISASSFFRAAEERWGLSVAFAPSAAGVADDSAAPSARSDGIDRMIGLSSLLDALSRIACSRAASSSIERASSLDRCAVCRAHSSVSRVRPTSCACNARVVDQQMQR